MGPVGGVDLSMAVGWRQWDFSSAQFAVCCEPSCSDLPNLDVSFDFVWFSCLLFRISRGFVLRCL